MNDRALEASEKYTVRFAALSFVFHGSVAREGIDCPG